MVDLSIMTGNRCTAPYKNFIWKQSVAQKETPFIQRLDAADLRVPPPSDLAKDYGDYFSHFVCSQ